MEEIKPDLIYHLALGPVSYAELLASYSKENDIPFVYISTVSVFEDNDGGPYTKDTVVKAKNDYGKYKYDCENAVREIYKNSYIIRIGWQISEIGDSTSNNMFRFIKDNTNEQNEIIVSDESYPSVSFLNETVNTIRNITESCKPDLYLVNSNTNKSLYDIVTMLCQTFGLGIKVINDSTFKRNDIMIDNRVNIPKI